MEKQNFSSLFLGKRQYKELYYREKNKRNARKREVTNLGVLFASSFVAFCLGVWIFHTSESESAINSLLSGFAHALLPGSFTVTSLANVLAWLLLPIVLIFLNAFSCLSIAQSSVVIFARSIIGGFGTFALLSSIDGGFFATLAFIIFALFEAIMLFVLISYAQSAYFYQNYIFTSSTPPRRTPITLHLAADFAFFCGIMVLLFLVRGLLVRLI